MAIYRRRPFGAGVAHPGELKLALASQLLMAEGISSPRRAGCLGLKAFHGPGEPDASLGELGSRKIHKMTLLPPFPCIFLFP